MCTTFYYNESCLEYPSLQLFVVRRVFEIIISTYCTVRVRVLLSITRNGFIQIWMKAKSTLDKHFELAELQVSIARTRLG